MLHGKIGPLKIDKEISQVIMANPVFFFATHRFGPWILFSTTNGGDFHMIQFEQHLFQNGWLNHVMCSFFEVIVDPY